MESRASHADVSECCIDWEPMTDRRKFDRRHSAPVVEYYEGVNVDADEQAYLLPLFRSAIKAVAGSRVRQAVFYSGDFGLVGDRNVVGYVLTVRRIAGPSATLWQGVFERGEHRLEVLGSIDVPGQRSHEGAALFSRPRLSRGV